jgi:hypothetical protein
MLPFQSLFYQVPFLFSVSSPTLSRSQSLSVHVFPLHPFSPSPLFFSILCSILSFSSLPLSLCNFFAFPHSSSYLTNGKCCIDPPSPSLPNPWPTQPSNQHWQPPCLTTRNLLLFLQQLASSSSGMLYISSIIHTVPKPCYNVQGDSIMCIIRTFIWVIHSDQALPSAARPRVCGNPDHFKGTKAIVWFWLKME